MNESVHFSVKYDGPALASHQMDVRELAPALIALSKLLEGANRAAFPQASQVRVQVSGGFKGGSFGIDLIAVQTVAQQLVTLLSGPNVTAAANLVTLLTGLGLVGKGGLIALIRWLDGRKPTLERQEGDKAIFEVHDHDPIDTFETDLVTQRLFHTRDVRQELVQVLRPLEQDGIELFACSSEDVVQVSIHRDEMDVFVRAASEPDKVSDTFVERQLLRIESAVFRDGNKWRFSTGGPSFYAEITDPAFLALVNAAEVRFGKGDVLVADVRSIQTVSDIGLRHDHMLVHVHEHRPPLQPRLS